MKTLRPLALAFCAALLLTTARATTVIPPTFDELVKDAEVILQGTVTNVQSQFVGEGAQRHIVTYVTFHVEDALKGNPGQDYTIRMLGGTVGDETLTVSDAPTFKVGEREIVFVENNGKQFIPLVGIMHGRFHVEQDRTTGANIVLANNGNAVTSLDRLGRVDANGAQVSSNNAIERPLDADSFKAAIRQKLNGVQ